MTPGNPRLALWVLMLGNWTIGTGVLAPAGLLDRLATSFDTSIAQTGALMWSGAIVLGIGAPLLAWLLARIDRRVLLAASFGLYVLGYALSMLVTDFDTLLVIRLFTVLAAAIYTPQAAAVAGLLVPGPQRAASIAFVFLGWSLAAAFGMPMAALLGAWFNWQTAYGVIAVLAAVQALALLLALPGGLVSPRVSAHTWQAVGRSAPLLRILVVTAVLMTAQFAVVTYLAPELQRKLSAGPTLLAGLLALYGICGVFGNIVVTHLSTRMAPLRVLQLTLGGIVAGFVFWANAHGSLALVCVGIVLWGLGGFASMSVQQSRLILTAPELAPATAALNSSALYLGQAVGGVLGAVLIANGLNAWLGWAGAALAILAWIIVRQDWQG